MELGNYGGGSSNPNNARVPLNTDNSRISLSNAAFFASRNEDPGEPSTSSFMLSSNETENDRAFISPYGVQYQTTNSQTGGIFTSKRFLDQFVFLALVTAAIIGAFCVISGRNLYFHIAENNWKPLYNVKGVSCAKYKYEHAIDFSSQKEIMSDVNDGNFLLQTSLPLIKDKIPVHVIFNKAKTLLAKLNIPSAPPNKLSIYYFILEGQEKTGKIDQLCEAQAEHNEMIKSKYIKQVETVRLPNLALSPFDSPKKDTPQHWVEPLKKIFRSVFHDIMEGSNKRLLILFHDLNGGPLIEAVRAMFSIENELIGNMNEIMFTNDAMKNKAARNLVAWYCHLHDKAVPSKHNCKAWWESLKHKKPAPIPAKKPEDIPPKNPQHAPAKKPENIPPKKRQHTPAKKPEHTPAKKPEHTPAKKPEHTKPIRPEETKPKKPKETKPKKPEEIKPQKPANTKPKESDKITPKKPADTKPKESESTPPKKPESTPAKTPESTPPKTPTPEKSEDNKNPDENSKAKNTTDDATKKPGVEKNKNANSTKHDEQEDNLQDKVNEEKGKTNERTSHSDTEVKKQDDEKKGGNGKGKGSEKDNDDKNNDKKIKQDKDKKQKDKAEHVDSEKNTDKPKDDDEHKGKIKNKDEDKKNNNKKESGDNNKSKDL